MTSIRIALALRERLGVEARRCGCNVDAASARMAAHQRAIWGLGATSLPVRDSGDLVGTAPGVFFGERGTLATSRTRCATSWRFPTALSRNSWMTCGVLDTPERATHFRALAKGVPPEAIASIDEGRESTHAVWMASIEGFQEQHPPEKGRTHRLGPERTDVASASRSTPAGAMGLRTALGPEAAGISDRRLCYSPQDGGNGQMVVSTDRHAASLVWEAFQSVKRGFRIARRPIPIGLPSPLPKSYERSKPPSAGRQTRSARTALSTVRDAMSRGPATSKSS